MSPFQLKEEGKLTGFAVEIVNDIQSRLSVKQRIEVYPWARAYTIAQKEPNVFIFTLVKTPERVEKFQWVGEYYVATDSFYVLRSRNDIVINSIEDAKKYLTCVPRNDVAEQRLVKLGFGDQHLKRVAFQSQCLGMLHRGRVDLMLFNEQGINRLTAKYKLSRDDFNRAFVVSKAVMGIAASKQTDPKLVADVRRALLQIKAEAGFLSNLNKWFNATKKTETESKE